MLGNLFEKLKIDILLRKYASQNIKGVISRLFNPVLILV